MELRVNLSLFCLRITDGETVIKDILSKITHLNRVNIAPPPES
jgi:hypothetical protein